MADIISKEIRGLNIKLLLSVVGATATIVSFYFITTGQIYNRIESVDIKLNNVLFRDSLRLEIIGLQMQQLRNDINETRRSLDNKKNPE